MVQAKYALRGRYKSDAPNIKTKSDWNEWVDDLPLPEFMALISLPAERNAADLALERIAAAQLTGKETPLELVDKFYDLVNYASAVSSGIVDPEDEGPEGMAEVREFFTNVFSGKSA